MLNIVEKKRRGLLGGKRHNTLTAATFRNPLEEEITPWKLMKSHKLMRGKLRQRGVSAFSLAFPSSVENGRGQDPYF